MKKLFLFTLLIGLISCGPTKEELDKNLNDAKQRSKFKEGEIVYLKPDSAKAVIIELIVDYDNCYCKVKGTSFKVRTSKGEEKIKESLIYPNTQSEY